MLSQVNFMTAGGVAGLIYEQGYQDCASIPTSGGFSTQIALADMTETVNISFAPGTKTINDGGTNISLDKRITAYFPNFNELEHYEFSCAQPQYGWHYISEDSSEQVKISETFWAPTFVETYTYRDDSYWGEEKSIVRLEPGANPGNFHLWSTRAGSWSGRTAVIANGTTIQKFEFNGTVLSVDSDWSNAASSYDACFNFSTGEWDSCGGTVISPPAPQLIADWSINSLAKDFGPDTSHVEVGDIILGSPQNDSYIIYAGEFGGYHLGVYNSSNYMPWSINTDVTSATSDTDGLSNTLALITVSPADYHAADECGSSWKFGLEWYLPAIQELELLYTNRNAIGGFWDVEYWSSTQANTTMAKVFNFNNGTAADRNKLDGRDVRCITRL